MIDVMLGQVLRLIVLVAVAVAVAQNIELILSLLLGALLFLGIARLLWPTPRR